MKAYNVKKILVPVDFSKTGIAAIEQAGYTASLFKAELILMHVIEIPESNYGIYNPLIQLSHINRIENFVTHELEMLAKSMHKKYNIKTSFNFTMGKISQEIASMSRKMKVDLVIMGTHGSNGFDEFFIGSNAQKTVASCPCPILTIQPQFKQRGFKKIMLPIDDLPNSRRKTMHAITLAKIYKAQVYLLGMQVREKWEGDKKIKKLFSAIESDLKKAGIPFEGKIVPSDNPAFTTLKYASRKKADLIVILPGEESLIKGFFPDIFASQLVNHSRIPVLSVKSKLR